MSADLWLAAPPWNRTPVRTRLFDGISLLLPAAEAFMIDTLSQWLAQAGPAIDDELRSGLDRFIREERAHQRAHHRYNQALLAQRPGAEEAAQRAARSTEALAHLGLPMRMALAAAFEQVTAVLSREVIEGRYLIGPDAGNSIQARMWHWHAREELAHCHIALQAALRAGIGRGRKALALCVASGFLLFDIGCAWWALCRCDIAAGASRTRMALDALRFAAGALPSMARMAVGWLRCLAS